MGTVNMAVDFGGVKMQNPINTAAGTFGYGWQFQNFFDVSQLGAITTKGCAAEPWPGNPAPRMAEIPGGMINSVGLQNPGVAAFARESGPWLEQLSKDGCQVICQVAGHSVDEFVRALEMYVELCPWAAGYEINVSCPNIAAGGAAMGYAFGAAVITSLSFLLLNIGIAGAGAAQASFATLIEPVASVSCGGILLNVKVTLFTIIGIGLILLSVWVNSMHTHEKAPAREKAPAK